MGGELGVAGDGGALGAAAGVIRAGMAKGGGAG